MTTLCCFLLLLTLLLAAHRDVHSLNLSRVSIKR